MEKLHIANKGRKFTLEVVTNMKLPKLVLIIGVVFLLINSILADNMLMPFQGKILNGTTLVQSGDVNVTFYGGNSLTGALYSELFSSAINNGFFNLMLGNNTSALSLLYMGNYSYRIIAGGVAYSDSFMSPSGNITSEWIQDNNITATDIQDGTIGANDIGVGVINDTHILNNTIRPQDFNVSRTPNNGEILAYNSTYNILTWRTITDISGGNITGGSFTNLIARWGNNTHLNGSRIILDDLSPSSVNTTQIVDSTILGADISDGTITSADIGFAAINSSLLAFSSVNASHILYRAINATHIDFSIINSSHIGFKAINSSLIDFAAINGSLVAYDTLNTSHIINNTLRPNDLNTSIACTDGQIFSFNSTYNIFTCIAAGSGSGNVTGGGATNLLARWGNSTHLNQTQVVAQDIIPSAINSTHIATDAVTTTEILDGTIVAGDIQISTITANRLAPESINDTHIINSTIRPDDLNISKAPTASQILSWNSTYNIFTWVADQTGGSGGGNITGGSPSNTLAIWKNATHIGELSNPSNCGAGQWAAGIDATGAAEGCTTDAGGGNITGGGAVNKTAVWGNATHLKEGSIFDNGTKIGINTTTPIGLVNIEGWYVNISRGSLYINETELFVFRTIDATSGTDPVADGIADTLTLTAGSGITVTGDSAADSVTLACTLGDTVESSEILDGTIVAGDIQISTITANRLAPESINDTHIINSTIRPQDFNVSRTPNNGEILVYNSTYNIFTWGGTASTLGNTTGGNASNYVARWVNATHLYGSILYDSGSAIGLGTTTPTGGALNILGGNLNISQANLSVWNGTLATYWELGRVSINSTQFNDTFFVVGNTTLVGNLTINGTGTSNATIIVGDIGKAGCIQVRDQDTAGWSFITFQSGRIINGTGTCL